MLMVLGAMAPRGLAENELKLSLSSMGGEKCKEFHRKMKDSGGQGGGARRELSADSQKMSLS